MHAYFLIGKECYAVPYIGKLPCILAQINKKMTFKSRTIWGMGKQEVLDSSKYYYFVTRITKFKL